jgi:hypothetical protein
LSDQSSPFSFAEDCEQYLRTLAKLYEHDGRRDLQSILVNAKVSVDEGITVGGDDMNVYGHTLRLSLPESLFTFGMKETLTIQDRIKKNLNEILIHLRSLLQSALLK